VPGQLIYLWQHYLWQHYLMVAQFKPKALRNGAPFKTLPDSFKHLQSILLQRQGGDRGMVEVLSLVLHHDEALLNKQSIWHYNPGKCRNNI
jgi:hypothetical protein